MLGPWSASGELATLRLPMCPRMFAACCNCACGKICASAFATWAMLAWPGGRVRNGRSASSYAGTLPRTRGAACVDSRTRRRGCADRRAGGFPRCGICAKHRRRRRRRRASTIVTPANADPISVCPLARRPTDRVRGVRRRRLPPLAAVPGRNHGAAAGRNRGRGLSLLVARQPLRRVLCRWQAEAARHRRRRAANSRNGSVRPAAGPGTRTASSCSRQPARVRCSACRPREARPWP